MLDKKKSMFGSKKMFDDSVDTCWNSHQVKALSHTDTYTHTHTHTHTHPSLSFFNMPLHPGVTNRGTSCAEVGKRIKVEYKTSVS